MAFPKYESYKDSGVDWLGEIPEDWIVQRNLGLFDERKEVNQPEMELLSVTIEQGVIRQSEILTKKDSSNEDKSKYKVVCKGDLAYNKMRMWQGAIGMSDYDGIVSPAYVILNTRNKEYSKYFHYLYRTEIFIREANRHSYGLCSDMNSLRYEDFKTIYSPIPPQDEVDRIVAFLDRTTAEIDEAIAKKQRLIELLQEQKAILINQAVTKGLNPNVPMRNSGFEWIGEIPEHWKLAHNRRFLKKLEQGSSPAITNSTEDEDFFVLKLSAIKHGNYIDGEDKIIPQKDFVSSYQVKKDDLLMTRGNTPDLVADIGYVDIEVTKNVMISDLIYRLTYNQQVILHKFMAYFFQSSIARYQIKICARGSSHTMVKVSQDHIRSWLVIIPPLDEQKEIISYLSYKINEFQFLEDKANQAIEKMNELKAVFITQAVTGKIKI
ncbi:MAG: restriction endonuclease subunit S [Rivularia sp. (in: Bacteria)]|nr:restriction endonuclease subunit S [Rivularia sp. MS3]